MKFFFEKKLVAVFVSALVAIIITVAISYHNYKLNLQNNSLVLQTTDVIRQTDAVLSNMQDAEAGARGFFISGDSSFLRPFKDAKVNEVFDEALLKKLTAGNPFQSAKVDSMIALASERLQIATLLISSGKPTQPANDYQLSLMKLGKKCMDSLRAIHNAINGKEQALLLQRKQGHERSMSNSGTIFILLLCVISTLLIISGFIIYHYLSLAKKESVHTIWVQKNLINSIKESSAKLAVTESQYKTLFQNMLHGFAYCKVIYQQDNAVDIEYISVNNVYESLTGLNNVIGKRISSFLPTLKQDDPTYFERINRVATFGTTERFETYVPTLDRWFSITLYSPAKGFIISLVDNITEQKIITQQIANSEKRFRSLIDNNYDIISLVDASFKLIYRSPSAARITGWSDADLEGLKGNANIHPDDLELAQNKIEEAIAHVGKSVKMLIRNQHKLGHYCWLEGTISNRLNDANIKAIIFNLRDVTERIEAEEKSKKSEHTLKAIFENTSEGFVLIDKTGTVLGFNEKANYFSALHKAPTIKIGQSALDFVEIEKQSELQEVFNKILGGSSIQFDRLYKTENADTWVNYALNPVIENGIAESMCITAANITSRKENERKLQQAHDRLFFQLENSPLGFIEWDENLFAKSFSKRAEQILGWTELEFIEANKKGTSLIFEADQQKAYHTAIELTSGIIKRNQLQYRIVHKDGRIIWCEWFNSVMKDERGKVITIMSLVRDITQQKNAEEQLRISNERFETLSNVTNDPVWDWNLRTDEVFWNENFFAMLGYDRNKHVPSLADWSKKIHPDDYEKVISRLSKIRKNIVNDWLDEFRYELPDGSYGTVIDRAQVIRDDFKNPVRVMGTLMDITERKNKEEQLLELNQELNARAEALVASNAELEQFAYIASHDLQEPLRMVTSFLSLLEKKYGASFDETAKKYIWFATDGAERMRKMIFDLLEYSRVGRKKQEHYPVDLNQLINEIIQQNETLVNEKKAVIEFDDLPEIWISKTPLLQVFQNLIGNALKYQNPDNIPTIKISAIERARHWEFSVADNGMGIEPQFFEKIFVLFQRLYTREQFAGTGIGLAICKKIIENYNGKIWLESIPGEGSKFYFTIPHEHHLANLTN